MKIRPNDVQITQMTKERPRCRQVIINLKLRPNLKEDGTWDGTSIEPNGKALRLSDGIKSQMRKMIIEGHWSKPKRSK